MELSSASISTLRVAVRSFGKAADARVLVSPLVKNTKSVSPFADAGVADGDAIDAAAKCLTLFIQKPKMHALFTETAHAAGAEALLGLSSSWEFLLDMQSSRRLAGLLACWCCRVRQLYVRAFASEATVARGAAPAAAAVLRVVGW